MNTLERKKKQNVQNIYQMKNLATENTITKILMRGKNLTGLTQWHDRDVRKESASPKLNQQ